MENKKKEQPQWKKYLKWALIVFGIIIVYNVIVSDDEESTDNGESITINSSKKRVRDILEFVDVSESRYAIVIKIKNISKETINDTFKVRIEYKDGVSSTEDVYIRNMSPGDIQEKRIQVRSSDQLSSWGFVNW